MEDKIKNSGIFCLTKEKENTLMWAHYAKNHSGFCLTYKIPQSFIRENSHEILGWDRVQYENDGIKKFFFSLSPENNTDIFENYFTPLVIKCFTTKSESWSYEKEFRIIRNKDGIFDVDKSYLKGICFGLSTQKEHISLIKKIIESHGYDDVSFSRMIKSTSQDFGLEEESH